MGKQLAFEEWDAVEAPGGVGDFVGELRLGGRGGGVLIEKLLDVALVSVGVLNWQEGGAGSGRHSFTPLLYLCSPEHPIRICRPGEAVTEGVERRALLARFGARAGGVRGVGAVDGGATL